jgi:hypothetical protein
MKKMIAVTQVVEVELDASKFTDEWLREWRRAYYNFRTADDHAEHIAQLEARSILRPEFTEGYGPLADMGIRAKVIDTTIDVIDD